MKQSRKLALSGVMCALATVVLCMSFIPYLTYAVPALAGALFTVIVIEISKGWAVGAYVATSILGLLICPDKEAAVMFVGFFGYYPILKSVLEKIRVRAVEYILKFLIFNIAVIACYLVIVFVFNIPFEGLGDFGRYTILILLAGGNLVFFVYDFALTRALSGYSGRLSRFFRGK